MTVSGFTAISRVLGFLRDMLVAQFIGAGLVGDAFFAAFRFPNLFRRIFGEGAFNAAFVPMFGKRLGDDAAGAMRFASRAFSMLLAVLGIFTIIAIPAMPLLMSVVVPGFKARETLQLSAESQEIKIELKGASSVFFELAEGQELKLNSPSFGKVASKGIGSLFGKESALENFPVGEPEVDAAIPVVLGPLPMGSEEEKESSQEIRRTSFVVEGAVWEVDGFTRSLAGDFLKISRPTGKVGEGMDWFTGELTGQGEVKIFRNHPDTFELTVKLARIMFVYLLCMALAAHLSGVLNTFNIFGMPAAVPIFLNITLLFGLMGIWVLDWAKGETLAWCVAIAGVIQLGALWVTCQRRGSAVHVVKPVLDADMKRLFGLMGPGVASASVQQINLLVGGIIASFQPSAVSWLYYSDRIYQLPLGMIGIALGVVLLPEVTRQLRGGMEHNASKTIIKGIELGLLITLPAAVAMMVVPDEIIAGLFQRGEFTRADVRATAAALAAFAVGLPGYVLIKVLQPGYFAREDTRSPMKMAVVTVAVNIVVSLLLFPLIGHVGLAVATSIAAWVNVFLLLKGLKGFLRFTDDTFFRMGRIVLASTLMGVVLYSASQGLQSWFIGHWMQRVVALVLLVGTGLSAYGALALFLRATSIKDLKAGFKR